MEQTKTVTIKQPILRGETEIAEITVRKPNVIALKGLKLLDLMQSDVNSLTQLLPRITMPMLTKSDIEKMDVADFTKLTAAVFDAMGLNEEEAENGEQGK